MISNYSHLWRLFVVLLTLGSAIGQGRAAENDQEILRKMIETRTALVSGICEIRGSRNVRKGTDLSVQEEVKYDLRFDFAAGKTLFEQIEGVAFLTTGDYRYYAPSSRIEVRRYELTELPTASTRPFDIRTLGFYFGPGQYLRIPECIDFPRMCENMLQADVVKSAQEGALTVLHLELPKPPGAVGHPRYVVWLDPAKDYVTVKVQGRSFADWDEVLSTSEMEWEQINGVWLMTSYSARSPRKHDFAADWTLTWNSVNGPLPQNDFRVERLIPPGRIAVEYTRKDGEHIELGIIDTRGR